MGTFASVSLYDRGSTKPVSGRTVRVTSWPEGGPVETDPAVLTTDYYGATPEFQTVDPDVHTVRISAGVARPRVVFSIEKLAAAEPELPASADDGDVLTWNASIGAWVASGGSNVAASLDPADPTGLTLLLSIPSNPSVALTGLAADGFKVTATFTGTSPEGLSLSYSLDWGDGTTTSPASSPVSHTYASTAATYTVTVTVTDSEGGTATDSAQVSVAPPGLSAYGAQVYADNPVIYLPFSSESTPLADYMGTVTPTIATGTITSDAHDLGDGERSAKFSDAALNLGTPSSLNSLGAFTFECLVRQSIANAQGSLFSRQYTTGGRKRGAWLSWTASGGIILKVGVNGPELTTPAFGPTTPNDRLHVAVTWDGSTWTLYINGAAEHTLSESGSLPVADPSPWLLGRETIDGGQTLYAWMAGAAFYDHALPPARIAAHAAAAGL